MIEVERKFRINNEQFKKIQTKFKLENPAAAVMRQVDEVYLYQQKDFKNFKSGNCVLRIRSSGDDSFMTLKKTINNQGDSVEHEIQISSDKVGREILKEMGYILVVKIVKNRIEIKKPNLTIALDEVNELGTFLEVEMLVTELSQRTDDLIMETAKEYGVRPEALEAKKYDRLILEMSS